MRPSIQGGELAYADRDTSNVKPGDLVATKDRLHMVTAASPTAVLTSGIANRHSDPWSPRSELQYIVRYIVRP